MTTEESARAAGMSPNEVCLAFDFAHAQMYETLEKLHPGHGGHW